MSGGKLYIGLTCVDGEDGQKEAIPYTIQENLIVDTREAWEQMKVPLRPILIPVPSSTPGMRWDCSQDFPVVPEKKWWRST